MDDVLGGAEAWRSAPKTDCMLQALNVSPAMSAKLLAAHTTTLTGFGMQIHAINALVVKLPFLRFRSVQQMSPQQCFTSVCSVDISQGKADNQC